MSSVVIAALREERARAQELFADLSSQQWAAASGCEGWRVQDVACHMASVFHLIADPTTIPGGGGTDAEADAEVPVEARRHWTPAEVVVEYDTWSEVGIAALTAMQEPGLAETVIPMANLGHHPMRLLANAIVFDHYCHLRHDIGRAVPAAAALPQDAAALDATVEWMLAGLPQMCSSQLADTPAVPVNLVLEGPGGGEWHLVPEGEGRIVILGRLTGAATVTSSAHSFVSWGTRRTDWREMATLVDDPDGAAASVLDAFNVI